MAGTSNLCKNGVCDLNMFDFCRCNPKLIAKENTVRLYEIQYRDMLGEVKYYYLDATDATAAKSRLLLVNDHVQEILSASPCLVSRES